VGGRGGEQWVDGGGLRSRACPACPLLVMPAQDWSPQGEGGCQGVSNRGEQTPVARGGWRCFSTIGLAARTGRGGGGLSPHASEPFGPARTPEACFCCSQALRFEI
jgi:hypothetical protein